MGSGANWVSCHLALFLSLLRFFTEQKDVLNGILSNGIQRLLWRRTASLRRTLKGRYGRSMLMRTRGCCLHALIHDILTFPY
ncbi:DUF3732 domain-containing protein [Paenibacillus sp. GXUN7292]|uniref:DUF3732 domain-containing protein n=1 Tax=Paenibacillus sp. GXUN7292 TaxID=3422499 RepID=UPI003D7C92AB